MVNFDIKLVNLICWINCCKFVSLGFYERIPLAFAFDFNFLKNWNFKLFKFGLYSQAATESVGNSFHF